MLPSADPAETGTVTARPLGPVSLALWISGLRCVATYVVLPFLAPVLRRDHRARDPDRAHAVALGAPRPPRALAQCPRWLAAGFAAVLLALNLLSLVTVLGQRR